MSETNRARLVEFARPLPGAFDAIARPDDSESPGTVLTRPGVGVRSLLRPGVPGYGRR
jgi:hypothetical protein